MINFWNSESKNMDAELAQIAEDGFNSIILVIPWREFQPGTNPITYNTYPWDKLDRVMEAAAAQNLSVMLRVGYTWDYYGRDNVLNRFQALLYDENVRLAWLDYVKLLYERTSAHENFCGGFLTWEDFWNFTSSAANFGKGAYSREMAVKVGYTDYLRERYSLEELGELYKTSFSSYDALYLPEWDSPARAVFYEFYNHFLNQLLAESQEVFPDLSMEVRLDGDPVTQTDGSVKGYMHSDTFACENASYSSTMYSIPMGQANHHERDHRRAGGGHGSVDAGKYSQLQQRQGTLYRPVPVHGQHGGIRVQRPAAGRGKTDLFGGNRAGFKKHVHGLRHLDLPGLRRQQAVTTPSSPWETRGGP